MNVKFAFDVIQRIISVTRIVLDSKFKAERINGDAKFTGMILQHGGQETCTQTTL